MSIKLLYLPVGRKTFDMEIANEYYVSTKISLKKNDFDFHSPREILTDVEDALSYLKDHKGQFDVIVFQHLTFTGAEFIDAIMDLVKVPIIVWGVKEPSKYSRLRLNSLTGVMSTSNYLKNMDYKFEKVLGNPDELSCMEEFKSKMNVIKTIRNLNTLKLALIGNYPPGFYYSDAHVMELKKTFGTKLEKYDLYKFFKEVKEIDSKLVSEELDYAASYISGLDASDDRTIMFGKALTRIRQIIENDNIGAIATRCWPDYFNELDIAPHGIIAQLNSQEIATSNEGDIHGALSLYVLKELSKEPYAFLGDIVSYDKDRNSIILWHDGYGPYQLANDKYGVESSVHPNRKIGPTVDFVLKPGAITLFRIHHDSAGYKFVITEGQVLDTENPYKGVSAEVMIENKVEGFLENVILNGYEPHFGLAYGSLSKELVMLARSLDIRVEVV